MKSIYILITISMVVSNSIMDISAQDATEDKMALLEHTYASVYVDTNNLVALAYHSQIENNHPRLVVRIFDATGYQVYFCHIRKPGATKVRFDISQFEDGTYNIGLYSSRRLICSKTLVKRTQGHFGFNECFLEISECLDQAFLE